MKKTSPAYLLPLIIAGMLMGIIGGWIRLGHLTFPLGQVADHHGLLMVGSSLGSLISLERSMVMKNRIWLAVPLASGISVPFLLGGLPMVGAYLLLGASVGLVSIMYFHTLKESQVYSYIITLGAVAWMLGNLAYIYSDFVPMATVWWMAFLLFTILGERMELNKFLPTPDWARKVFYIGIALFGLGLLVPFHQWGNVILGSALWLMALWLFRFDMARHSVKKSGQFRYIGTSLFTGYSWLAMNGWIIGWMEDHPFYYDLYLHTFFLGFTFSMIWAHAPIILPMVFKIQVKIFHPLLWYGWWFFQFSLLGRITAAWLGSPEWRKVFGVLNGWAILVMFVLMGTLFFLRKNRLKNNAIEMESVL
ncbi:MAG: hypothetical protein WD398_15460 [Cyclobacteriaceae bacterium]